MIEITCQTCGEKTGVQSFLTAGQQPCLHCGQLLMGPAGRHGSPAFSPLGPGAGRSAGLWLGVFAGILAGVAGVAAVAHMGRTLPVHLQGAIFGALAGVLLGPVIAISSFLSMLVMPLGLEGMFGDSVWKRLAQANNERSLAPLLVPFLLVVLPMTLCDLGSSRLKTIPPGMVIAAGLGAIVLGAIVGGVFGSFVGSRRRQA